MTETLEWRAPNCVYRGNIASLYPKTVKHVSLMSRTGAALPQPQGWPGGSGDASQLTMFADAASIARTADAPHKLMRTWVRMKGGSGARLETGGIDMVVDVLTETVIARPLGEVAEYAADPTNAPRWYANIDSVEWQTEAKVETGAKVAFVARFLGRRLAYTYELVDVQPSQRLVMRTTEGPFPMETTYAWTALNDSTTRMSLRNRGEPAGFSRLSAPFMASAMRRANRKDLAALRTVLESTRA